MAAVSTNKYLCHCYLFALILIYIVAVQATVSGIQSVICGPPGTLQNIETLKQPSSWYLNNTKNTSLCVNGTGNNTSIGCDFLFSFCHAFNCSKNDTSLMNTTACINTVGVNKTSKSYKLGSYDPSINPFKEDPKGKGLKFIVEFKNGSQYQKPDNASCNLSMDMHFNCNMSGIWNVKPDLKTNSTVSQSVLKGIAYDAKTCKYTISVDYNGACPTETPMPVDKSVQLSAGSVLIIIFFVAVGTYFILGSGFNFCTGSRGRDVIPQSGFWTMLPVYVADGCIFTCGGCKSAESTSSKYDSI